MKSILFSLSLFIFPAGNSGFAKIAILQHNHHKLVFRLGSNSIVRKKKNIYINLAACTCQERLRWVGAGGGSSGQCAGDGVPYGSRALFPADRTGLPSLPLVAGRTAEVGVYSNEAPPPHTLHFFSCFLDVTSLEILSAFFQLYRLLCMEKLPRFYLKNVWWFYDHVSHAIRTRLSVNGII